MAKNEALSEFLTGKRAAVSPAQAGLTVSGPRRVPGLRREEVAILAGVSVDWYVRLEQGRQVTPSASVLGAIGRILRLDDAEQDYLVNLARPAPGIGGGRPDSPVRPGIVRMLRAFDRQAAFVVGPRSEVLTGNDLAWALLTDFPGRAPGDRNLLRWMLLDDSARALYKEWDQVVSDQVGVLQLEASAHPNDPAMEAFVGELATKSAEFRTWWSIPNPQGRTAGRKTFVHPVIGEMLIDWEAFIIPGTEGQTLFVNTPADAAAEESMRLLASWWATERADVVAEGRVPTRNRPASSHSSTAPVPPPGRIAGMSMAKPFMPAHQPAQASDPTDHDIDTDVDVIFESGPAEDGEAVHPGAADPAFRTPVAGERLTAQELAAELSGEDAGKN